MQKLPKRGNGSRATALGGYINALKTRAGAATISDADLTFRLYPRRKS